MSLKQELETYIRAVSYYDQKDYESAFDEFQVSIRGSYWETNF